MINQVYIIEGNSIEFILPFNKSFIERIKSIPGRKYNPIDKIWSCEITQFNIDQIQEVLNDFNFLPFDDSSFTLFQKAISEFSLNFKINKTKQVFTQKIEEGNYPITLRNYQVDVACYMLSSKRCINASDMGTGKTFTSIFCVDVENLYPCLVITPASIKYNWKNQWGKVNPESTIEIIESDDFNQKADVFIINYDRVGKKVKPINEDEKPGIVFKYPKLADVKFKSIICDESHYLKDSKSVRSKSVKQISKGVDYVFLLTGTPIMNRPSEIISQLEILRVFNQIFTSWKSFVFRYCDASKDRFGYNISGASNLLELNQKLSSSCYVRVEKRDVIDELPSIQENILQVEIDNLKEYSMAENDLILYLKENFGQEKANAAVMAEQLVLINTLRQISIDGKINSAKELIQSFIDQNESKLIVFGVFRRPLIELSDYFECDVIYGGVDAKRRQFIIDDFQTNKKKVLFLNIQSGSVGIDGLQNVSSSMLFLELPWRYTDVSQAISRIERINQKNSIDVNYLIGNNTIDEVMFDLIIEKRLITDAVTSGIEQEKTGVFKQILSHYL